MWAQGEKSPSQLSTAPQVFICTPDPELRPSSSTWSPWRSCWGWVGQGDSAALTRSLWKGCIPHFPGIWLQHLQRTGRQPFKAGYGAASLISRNLVTTSPKDKDAALSSRSDSGITSSYTGQEKQTKFLETPFQNSWCDH